MLEGQAHGAMGKWARLLVVASGGSRKNKRKVVLACAALLTASVSALEGAGAGKFGGVGKRFVSQRGGYMAAMRTWGTRWACPSGGVAEALSVMCRGSHDGVGWAPLYLEVGRLRSPDHLLAYMSAYGLFAWFVPQVHFIRGAPLAASAWCQSSALALAGSGQFTPLCWPSRVILRTYHARG